MKMKIKTIGKKLNGQHLNSLVGTPKERTHYKKYLLEQLKKEEVIEAQKTQCRQELEHLRELEKNTSDRQEKHAAFRLGVTIIWSIILIIFTLEAYFISTHLSGQLDITQDSTKIIFGVLSTLIAFIISAASGALLRGAQINIKEQKKDGKN